MDSIKKFADKVKKEWDARTPQERVGLVAGSVIALVGIVVLSSKVAKKDQKQEPEPEVAPAAKGGNFFQDIVDKVTGAAK